MRSIAGRAHRIIGRVGILALALAVAMPAAAGAFNDVDDSDFFADAVAWMTDEGITSGTGECTFSPYQDTTRGEVAAFLWREAGEPRVVASHGFVDVAQSWQQQPVAWMKSRGITTGTSATTFSPEAPITRAEFAAMLWRLEGRPSVSGGSRFADVHAPWQVDAVAWMREEGITTGRSANRFDPEDRATRGEIAVFLHRWQGTPSAPALSPCVSADGRRVIDMSSARGTVVLDRANTIYDFGNVSASRDITIAASNVEARNIRGSGARRIGERDGKDYRDSGFRNFEFTYLQTQNGGGGDIIRPYFVNGTDVNRQPHVGDGSIVHIYAYQGDIIDPLLDNVTIYGKRRPSGSTAHNDGIHFTSTTGTGDRIVNPTVRNSTIYSGSAFAILARHTYGTFTLEGNTFVERYEAFHAVMGDARDVSSTVTVLWRNNNLDGSAVFVNGYRSHSSTNTAGADVTIER